MDETLRRLDELALELKLLTTEMREKGPVPQIKPRINDRILKMYSLMETISGY